MAESFEMAQWANQSAAAAASNQMAARTSAGTGALAELVRKQQDEAAELRSARQEYPGGGLEACRSARPKREAMVRQHRQEVEASWCARAGNMSTDFPEYADLVNPKPLALADAQKLLAPGEALVLFHVSDTGNYVWAITPDRIDGKRSIFRATSSMTLFRSFVHRWSGSRYRKGASRELSISISPIRSIPPCSVR